jgi:hypothetical protein
MSTHVPYHMLRIEITAEEGFTETRHASGGLSWVWRGPKSANFCHYQSDKSFFIELQIVGVIQAGQKPRASETHGLRAARRIIGDRQSIGSAATSRRIKENADLAARAGCQAAATTAQLCEIGSARCHACDTKLRRTCVCNRHILWKPARSHVYASRSAVLYWARTQRADDRIGIESEDLRRNVQSRAQHTCSKGVASLKFTFSGIPAGLPCTSMWVLLACLV